MKPAKEPNVTTATTSFTPLMTVEVSSIAAARLGTFARQTDDWDEILSRSSRDSAVEEDAERWDGLG